MSRQRLQEMATVTHLGKTSFHGVQKHVFPHTWQLCLEACRWLHLKQPALNCSLSRNLVLSEVARLSRSSFHFLIFSSRLSPMSPCRTSVSLQYMFSAAIDAYHISWHKHFWLHEQNEHALIFHSPASHNPRLWKRCTAGCWLHLLVFGLIYLFKLYCVPSFI